MLRCTWIPAAAGMTRRTDFQHEGPAKQGAVLLENRGSLRLFPEGTWRLINHPNDDIMRNEAYDRLFSRELT